MMLMMFIVVPPSRESPAQNPERIEREPDGKRSDGREVTTQAGQRHDRDKEKAARQDDAEYPRPRCAMTDAPSDEIEKHGEERCDERGDRERHDDPHRRLGGHLEWFSEDSADPLGAIVQESDQSILADVEIGGMIGRRRG